MAFGGDLVDVELAAIPDAASVEAMGSLTGARRVERRSATSLRLVVDDAAGRLPEVLAWCADRGLDVESADQVVPPFDDVFVDLVERHRGARTDPCSARSSARSPSSARKSSKCSVSPGCCSSWWSGRS